MRDAIVVYGSIIIGLLIRGVIKLSVLAFFAFLVWGVGQVMS